MITRPTSIALIEAVQQQEALDSRIGEAIDVLSTGDSEALNNRSFVYVTPLIDKVVRLLEAELEDEFEMITWWLWDLPDAGRNVAGSTITGENQKFVIRDAGDLYDWLRFGWDTQAAEAAS